MIAVARVIAPRFWAGFISMPILAALFSMVGVLGGYFVAVPIIGVDAGAFWSQMQASVDFRDDIVNGIIKSLVFGVFPGNSVERDYLPQAYSDFIYSIIVEEMGLIGGIVVIIMYLILLFRAGRIVMNCSSVFPAILVMGLSLMIVLQTFINMSVATSLIPVTGQPLPLISRGGTSILITCIYFGIILGITRQIIADEQPNDSFVKEDEQQLPVVELESL